MRRLILWSCTIFTACSVSNATAAIANPEVPSFFKLPNYPTENVGTEANLFLNPKDSDALFDPNELGIIGLGSADDVDYAFISSKKEVFYVKNGDEILPDIYVKSINLLEGIVEVEYRGRLIVLSASNPTIDK